MQNVYNITRRYYHYTGMVTKILWENPKTITQNLTNNTMWQVFDVGLFSERHNISGIQKKEFIRCKGHVPLKLEQGDTIIFKGKEKYNIICKRNVITIDYIKVVHDNENESGDLKTIARYSKGVSFNTIFKLNEIFKGELLYIIQNQPEKIQKIPKMGIKKISLLQKAVLKMNNEKISEKKYNIHRCKTISRQHHDNHKKQQINKINILNKDINIKNQKIEWIQHWCNDEHFAVNKWFEQAIEYNLSMYCWKEQYAPERKLIGKIENYIINKKNKKQNNDIQDKEINVLLKQSRRFRKQLIKHTKKNKNHLYYS